MIVNEENATSALTQPERQTLHVAQMTTGSYAKLKNDM